jgi:hypothetical protein
MGTNNVFTEVAGQDNFLAIVGDFSLTRVVALEEIQILHTVKLLTELGVVRIFGQKQPALQVVETEALE